MDENNIGNDVENVIAEDDLIKEDVSEPAAEEENGISEIERMKLAAEEAEAVSAKMREEYENARKAEKQRKKAAANANKRGVSAWACVMISAVSAFVVLVAAFAVLFLWKMPSSGKSFMATFVQNHTQSGPESEGDNKVPNIPNGTVVGGTQVPGGSDVTINIDGEADDNAAAVYAKCEQSIVGIRVVASTSGASWKNEYTTVGEGSGVIYSADGYIITNHHVIADAINSSGSLAAGYEIRVFFDEDLQNYSTAKIIGSDATTDLAVIKIAAENLKPIEIGDSKKVAVGDKVFAIGSPGGLEFMNSLSDGIVSGIERNVSTDSGLAYDLIQTNTAINPGNSGGALLNAKGELIGICFLKIVADGYEGMGFAIPSATVKDIVSTLISEGKVARAQLGISVNTTYNETEAENAGLPAGAWIAEVAAGSPAEKAGIEANSILTELNGEAVRNYYDLREELLKYKPGETVTVKVFCYNTRTGSGEYRDYTVVLGESE